MTRVISAGQADFGTDTPSALAQPILASIGADREFDVIHALRWAAKARKISVLRLVADIFRRRVGRQTLTVENYFHFGLHLARFTNAQRAEFIGSIANRRLNKALTDPEVVKIWRDKAGMAGVLQQAGLPTPPVRAVFRAKDGQAPDQIMINGVVNYLRDGATLPFFGKPNFGSAGRGAFSVVARQGSDHVVFGDGRVVEIAALAQEIAQTYPQGFLFQDKLQQHPDVAALAGAVMCSLRVMSVWVGGQFVPLYAGMRLPAPGAMLDITCTSTAAIDMATGRITRTQDGRRLGGHSLGFSLITGAALIGAQLPDWSRVMELASAAHSLFPTQGVLGIDIALTSQGPMIVELNSHPGHGGYHQTNDAGLLNPAFRKVFAAALAERGITRRGRGMLVP